MTAPAPREDILVSVCITDGRIDHSAAAPLRVLANLLDRHFRYWELLIGIDAEASAQQLGLLDQISNLRLLKLRAGLSLYRKRLAIATEAIGDVVVLASLDELPLVDLADMAGEAEKAGAIVIARRRGSSLLNPALTAIGSSAGFRVSARDMQTAAYPRAVLAKLLAHPDSQLALRFPPADEGIIVHWRELDVRRVPARGVSQTGRRLRLLHRLLVSCAPRVLTLVTVMSLLVALLAVLYGVYAVVVWLTFDHVQPGWFTTSAILSLAVTFLGLAVFGLTVGMHQLIEAVSRDQFDDVIEEASSLDLFSKVTGELNVDTAAALPPTAG